MTASAEKNLQKQTKYEHLMVQFCYKCCLYAYIFILDDTNIENEKVDVSGIDFDDEIAEVQSQNVQLKHSKFEPL